MQERGRVGEWVAIREIVQKLTNVAIKKNEEIFPWN
jgi:hypothetical protein